MNTFVIRDFTHGFRQQRYHIAAWWRLMSEPYNQSNHHHAFNMLDGDCVRIHPKPVWVVDNNFVSNVHGSSAPVGAWYNESSETHFEWEDEEGYHSEYEWETVGTFWDTEDGVRYSR